MTQQGPGWSRPGKPGIGGVATSDTGSAVAPTFGSGFGRPARWSHRSRTMTWMTPAAGQAEQRPHYPEQLGAHQHADQGQQ